MKRPILFFKGINRHFALTLVLMQLVCVISYSSVFQTKANAAAASHVVISEVYGGGGNSGATYKNDYIELYNPTNASVNITGWSVQYASATSVDGAVWQVTSLTGSINAHGYYLVTETGGTTGSSLPSADTTGSINLSGTNGKVALVNSTTALTVSNPSASTVDFVGYGTANAYEEAGAAALSSTTSARRKGNTGIDAGAGKGSGWDTDNNSSDFVVDTSLNPQNSLSAIEPALVDTAAPVSQSKSPVDGSGNVAVDGAVSVTFDENIVAGSSFASISIADSGSNPVSGVSGQISGNILTLTHDNFAYGNTYTVTIPPYALKDGNSNETTSSISWSFSTPASAPPATNKTFDLVEITDFHGQLLDSTGTYYIGAALSKVVKDIKSSNPDRTLILSGGDLYQGTPLSNVLHGVPVRDVMTDMGLQVTALGNHEFDWGLNVIENETMVGASYQIVCANLYKKGTNTREFAPYKVITEDGVRIAVIGAITNEAPTIILPANVADYDFRDSATEINTVAAGIRANNEADVIVVAIHEGSTALNTVVSQLHGVNAVFGGHSHTMLDTVLKDADNKNVPTLNANSTGKGYVDLKMTVNTVDNSISFSPSSNYKSLSVTAATPLDATAKNIIDNANVTIGPVFNEVIGSIPTALTSSQADSPYGESQLGNWMSDVIKNYAHADVGMQNNGGIRLSPVPAGNITVGTVFSLMPFDNTVCTVNMTGAQLKILLEQAVQNSGKGIQLSGIKFTYDSTKPSYTPTTPGQRVTKIVRESDNTIINDTDVLKVAAPDFMETGGDTFTEFIDPAVKTSFVDSHDLIRDALIADVRAKGTIPNVMNNRIVSATNGPAVEMTIAQARAVSSGNAILTGTVSVINGTNVFFQENIAGNVAGICLYNSKSAVVNKGDTIKVTGTLSLYNGLLEITPKASSDVQILSSGNIVTPKVVTVNQIDESVEGQVVQLKGVTIDNIDPTATSMIHDSTGSIPIYKIPALTGITAGDKVNVSAAVSQYATTYELFVGNAADITSASATVAVNSVTTSPGKDVPVKVAMSNMNQVAGVKVKLSYDSTKLTVKTVALDSQLSENAVNTDVPGEIYFDGVSSDGITAPTLDLATVTFTVNPNAAIGDLPINIVSAEACDKNLNNIAVAKVNGTISVTPSVLPVASNVTFTGEAVVGKVLTAKYDYADTKSRPDVGTSYRWLVAVHGSGNYAEVATGKTFTVTKEYAGKDIEVEVVPKNAEDSGIAVIGNNGRNQIIKLGDINKDGFVNFVDALQGLQSITGKCILDSKAAAAADVDNVDGVNVNDVVQILKADVELIVLN